MISYVEAHAYLPVGSSGSYLGKLSKEDLCVCYLNNSEKFEGVKNPSIETPFHRGIYQARPDVNAVLHFQSLYATTLSCAEKPDFNLNFILEVPAYINKISIARHSRKKQITKSKLFTPLDYLL